jgi:MoaA/NifB/PqqE/SkfB family radical SAM enzyme
VNALSQQSYFDHKNTLWLEVTNFCNLNCAHCYNSSGSHESLVPLISTERYEQIIDEASELQFMGIQFIGGEPFFYPYLQRLLNHALNRKFDHIELFSNMTVLPRWLFETRYRKLHLATSLYSDDPAVHDRICNHRGSFDRTAKSIRRVIEAGFTLRVGFIEMSSNKGHFERTQAYLCSLGVTKVGYDAARQFGRGAQGATPDMNQLCGKCGNGNLSIDVNGNVAACIMSKPWTFGNVCKENLATIFDSWERRRFVNQMNLLRKRNELLPTETIAQCGPGTCNPNCEPATDCKPKNPQLVSSLYN